MGVWNNFGFLIGPRVCVAAVASNHVGVRFGKTGKTVSPEFTVTTYPNHVSTYSTSDCLLIKNKFGSASFRSHALQTEVLKGSFQGDI